MNKETIQLTQFANGAGCSCKLPPAALAEILQTNLSIPSDRLLVGNDSRDDAAVYDLGNGQALISTTDFFTPIVDDPVMFGRIAAANAISDVYAMGGKPLMALGILGWPSDKLSSATAREVLEGGRLCCADAGIPLAGGHSISSSEPIFGLAVTGIVPISHLKRNDTPNEGNVLLLTKPLGTGILSSALKRGLLSNEEKEIVSQQLITLNKVGEALGALPGVTAMTDVTGFGFLGHLIEMIGQKELTAVISYASLPVLPGVRDYIRQRIFPDATTRNWNGYSSQVSFEKGVNVMEAFTLLPDPQTNGGLLVAVEPDSLPAVIAAFEKFSLGEFINPVGTLIPRERTAVQVQP